MEFWAVNYKQETGALEEELRKHELEEAKAQKAGKWDIGASHQWR